MGVLEPHRGDFYAYETLLPDDEQKEILRLRELLEREVRPIADEYWAEAEFPRHLIAPLRDLDFGGGACEGFRDPPYSRLFSGFTSLALSRVDPSFGTFFGVHAGLAFASIYHCGSPEQRDRWLPGMADLTSIGAFALTEPEHGSDIAGGLATTARRDGDHSVLNGKEVDRQRDVRRPDRGVGARRDERGDHRVRPREGHPGLHCHEDRGQGRPPQRAIRGHHSGPRPTPHRRG